MPGNVVQLEWIDNEKLDAYYSKFDAVIIPSRWEGFGLVAFEVMKNKTPVIASNRGALPELVKNGVNGYIFDLDHLHTLEEILNNLEKESLNKLGESGHKLFLKELSAEVMNERYMEQYLKVLE